MSDQTSRRAAWRERAARALSFVRRFAVLLLLSAAALLGALAWQMQSSAVADLQRARAVQQDEVGGDSGAPPKVAQYRKILDTLDRSLRIRKNIDASLGRIEKAVAALRDEGDEAAVITQAGGSEVEKIAETLGSAAGSARAVTDALGTLEGRLETSRSLSRLIAEELEELDRSFGPTLDPDILDRLDDILPGRS